ncbi:DUF2631 domain-containing protein [Longispora sp. NPDC051575]|uniref:DUF2631 domain-containing protein n=1 Tax=Longispora sp. NPDC051575 TaxID=3154943 RepID=UPI003427F9F6
MAGSSEPVTSPDQHKPTNLKAARIGGIVTILILLVMAIGNHEGNVENIWLFGLALLLAATIVGDWLLRKNGLKSN